MNGRGITGRGAANDPKIRFERIEVVGDLSYLDDLDPEEREEPKPETIYYRDRTKTIIATNDSPDIGFDASINPYRGCSHGCTYCMARDTLILIGDGRTKKLAELCVGDEVFGTVFRGGYRRYEKTRVLATWRAEKPAYRITLADGTKLVAGGDHRFLTERGWKYVTGEVNGRDRRPYLTTNNSLLGTGTFTPSTDRDQAYESGYVCGMIRGDGTFGTYEYPRNGRDGGMVVHRFRLALADEDALERSSEYLARMGIPTTRFVFQRELPKRGEIHAIRASSRGSVDLVRRAVIWPELPSESWRKGFLAGIFDAEGQYAKNTLRIFNSDDEIIHNIRDSLDVFGFDHVLETSANNGKHSMKTIRVRGGLPEHLRFFHLTDPAIARKRNIRGIAIKFRNDLRIASIKPVGTMPLYDITTGTGDFIANGVVSHNCFARPNHEYLGMSAGLDFETKIMVKENAPELLRRELSAKKWRPQTIAMSMATDCYQPIEKELCLTRRCLEVLVEFRNPVGIVTKNYLVTRDIDLLQELVKHDAVSVNISLTTLDDELRRRMEPRTSSPKRRLAAISKLSEAGIPVNVLVAPIIPGLTDHEMPKLLEAAANAGATSAGYTPVRLPYAVAPLFTDWLQRNYPDRKDKILNRIRELRGGGLNDPRFGSRMNGEGVYAEHLKSLFEISCRRAGLTRGRTKLSAEAFRVPTDQASLFD